MNGLSNIYPLTITCMAGCGRARAYRLEPMGVVPSPMIFCPFCGAQATTAFDHEQDIIELWSAEWGIPAELLRMLHAAWDYETHGSFREFAKGCVEGTISV